jgi:hypothetical protein
MKPSVRLALARLFKRLQAAAMGPDRDHAAALDSLRQVNRELLVVAFAEVPDQVAQKCDAARAEIIDAIRLLDPLPEGRETPAEELPPAEHRARVARAGRNFDPISDPPGQN